MQHADTLKGPLVEGIKLIGVGKNGSENCSPELSAEILRQITGGQAHPIQVGAFLGALFLKKPSADENAILQHFGGDFFSDPKRFASYFAQEDQPEHYWIARVLSGTELSVPEARALGLLLFSDSFQADAKAVIATYLRMKHASVSEYEGILQALHELYQKEAAGSLAERKSDQLQWQISEPFDGLEKNYLITPLLGRALVRRGHRVIHSSGPSSGPKFGTNFYSLTRDSRFSQIREFNIGEAVNVEDLFYGFRRWREIRRYLIKRPFMATIEKYFNPYQSDVLITSVFHATFKEKGNELIQKAGFRAGIVVFRGLEGSIQPSLARGTRLLASFQNKDGTIVEQEFESRAERYGFSTLPDNREQEISCEESVELLQIYLEKGRTQNEYYNARAEYLVKAFDDAIGWIENQFARDP